MGFHEPVVGYETNVSQVSYHRERARQERQRAAESSIDVAALLHIQLASLHQALADALSTVDSA